MVSPSLSLKAEARGGVPSRALRCGDRVAQYEITDFIGAGGMGEVYAALDTRLDRDVAVKVLPLAYGDDDTRTRRFAKEAKTLSRLAHPNIVTLFDAGVHGTMPYIVTERLHGVALNQLLAGEGLSIARVIMLATQLAHGLAAAHGQSIVHRDLKPANVFVTDEGHVKILDFGLARLLHPEWEHPADSSTVSLASHPGSLIGTVAYMSPEQVQEMPADNRSDIFSFGSILYEMLAGVRPFRGDSSVELMNDILRAQPAPVDTLRLDCPDSLARVVGRCLEAQPGQRFHSANDLAFALNNTTSSESRLRSVSRLLRRPTIRRWARSTVALIVLVGAFAATRSVLTTTEATSPADSRTVLVAPEPLTITPLTSRGDLLGGALSPDGRFLAFSTRDAGSASIRLSQLATGVEIELVSEKRVNGYSGLTFSPDGNELFYSRTTPDIGDAAVIRIPLLGGEPRVMIDGLRGANGLAVSPDGTEVAISRYVPGENNTYVVITSVDGSRVRELPPFRTTARGPAWSPDGRIITLQPNGPGLIEFDAATGSSRILRATEGHGVNLFSPQWLPDGSGLVGVSVESGRVIHVRYPGLEATPITEEGAHYSNVSLANDSAIFAIRSESRTWLWVAGLDGRESRITSGIGSEDGREGLTWLPDDRIAFIAKDVRGHDAVWICNVDGSNRRQLTRPENADHIQVAASPDGRTLVFVESEDLGNGRARNQLAKVNVSGGEPVLLTPPEQVSYARLPFFAPDGEWIIYSAGSHPWKVRVDGTERQRIGGEGWGWGSLHGPSPDGRQLAVTLYRNGPGGRVDRSLEAILPAGGGEPIWTKDLPGVTSTIRWAPDGKGLTYARLDQRSWSLWREDLASGLPRRLLGPTSEQIIAYAWSPDAKRLVISRGFTSRDAVLIENVRLPGLP